MAYLPLEGIRVLDLARMIPGDLATSRLADLGAEVVKVEEPGRGDYLRRIPPLYEGEGVFFLSLNRGKKSVELDLATGDGLALFQRLAEVTDVIVEVSHPDKFLGLGVDFAALRRRRPEIVICSITGFGQTGRLAQLPSHGMGMDSMAGLAPVVIDEQGWPQFDTPWSTSLSSELGAANAAFAIAASVYRARITGEGAWIDVSCWDCGAEINRAAMMMTPAGGMARDTLKHSSLYTIYTSSDDKPVLICAIERKFFERFCIGVDRPELLDRWHSPVGGEVDFGDISLRPELEKIFATATADVWLRRFVDWDVTGSLVVAPGELADLGHTSDRQLLDYGWRGDLANVRNPVRWMDDESRPGTNPPLPPRIGADTADVLERWLGDDVGAD